MTTTKFTTEKSTTKGKAHAQPFEHWPTRTAAVMDLARQGWTDQKIAERLGWTHSQVKYTRQKPEFVGLWIPREAYARFERIAAEHGVPPHAFIDNAVRQLAKFPAVVAQLGGCKP